MCQLISVHMNFVKIFISTIMYHISFFFLLLFSCEELLYFLHALHCGTLLSISALTHRQGFFMHFSIQITDTIYFLFCYCLQCGLNKTISEKSVMRAQESSSNHVNTSPSSSQETGLEWAHPRPPGPGRKWEEEEEREVAGSQRETEWGEIGRGAAHHARSKTKVMHRCSQNKHVSGGAFSKVVFL